MNAKEIIAKADRGDGLTVEEIKVYQQAVKPVKHVYGKYGTLALKYLEEHNVGKYWALENLPEYLHGIDKQADELYESMYARLSKDERYKRTGDFMEDYRRQTEIKQLIEEEILSELQNSVYGICHSRYLYYEFHRRDYLRYCRQLRGKVNETQRRYA